MKTLGFFLLEPFAEWERAYLASGLEMLAGDAWRTRFLSLDGLPARSIGGMTVALDGDVSEVPALDALAVIGGLGWRGRGARAFAPAAREFAKTGRPLGAICDAAGFLASLGLLDDRRHTGNGPGELASFAEEAYAGQGLYARAQAVRDKGVITANGTGALEFAREFLLEIGIDETGVEEWYEFHKVGFAALARAPAGRAQAAGPEHGTAAG